DGGCLLALGEELLLEATCLFLVLEDEVWKPRGEELVEGLAHERVRLWGSDEPPVHTVAEDEPILVVEERKTVLHALDGARQSLGIEARGCLETLPLADVANRGGHGHSVFRSERTQAYLDPDLTPIATTAE